MISLSYMETQPKILKWALIIGIVIVLNLFFNYTVSLVYKEPDYNSFFPQTQVVEPITNKEDCLGVGGQWYGGDNRYDQNGIPIPPVAVDGKSKPVPALGNCNPDYTKQQEFSNAQKVYQRNVFITLVVLGVISVVIGAFVGIALLASALSWGGVLSFIIASMRYWSIADNLVKVIILGISLAILIWLAVKKFKK